jgi:hypothetical protein
MPIHDFRCRTCKTVHDALVKADEILHTCQKCNYMADREFLKTPSLNYLAMGTQKHVSPEFQERFDKLHRDQKAKEEKSLKEHGDYGPLYNYQKPAESP